MEVDFPSALESQVKAMTDVLSLDGGFSPVSAEKTGDVILTAKIYRLIKCDNFSGLTKFIDGFIVDGYLAPNNDITQTDLRFYYSYFKLWLISKGEFTNDFFTTFE